LALGIVVGLGIEVAEHSDVVLDVVGLTSSDSPEQTFAGFHVESQEISCVAHVSTHFVQYFTEILQRLNFFFHVNLKINYKLCPKA
jgi:hypothetical protein